MVKEKASDIKDVLTGTDEERQAITGGYGIGTIFQVVTEVGGEKIITSKWYWAGSEVGWCKQFEIDNQ